MAIVKGKINSFEKVVDIVKENPSINFIAEIISPFHASSVFASILWIEEK